MLKSDFLTTRLIFLKHIEMTEALQKYCNVVPCCAKYFKRYVLNVAVPKDHRTRVINRSFGFIMCRGFVNFKGCLEKYDNVFQNALVSHLHSVLNKEKCICHLFWIFFSDYSTPSL